MKLILAGLSLTGAAMRAETIELPPDFSPWTWVVDLWADAGYQDNLLLSKDAREASSFAQLGGQVGLMRIPLGRFHFQTSVTGQEKRFIDGLSVDHERSFTSATEMSLDIGQTWRALLEVNYLFQDQVYDASVNETNLTSLPVMSHTVESRPGIRRDFNGGWWSELGANLLRQSFQQDDLDGYWEAGPRWLVGRRYGRNSEISAEAGVYQRWYDERVTYTSTGTPVDGDPLSYCATSLTLQWKHHWDERRRWRTISRATLERNQDNGSDYFGYDRVTVSEQLRYRTKKWECRAQIRFSHYVYGLQEADDQRSKRTRSSLRATLHGEYHLTQNLSVHGDYELERAISNRSLDEYTSNTVSLGLGYDF